MLIKKFCQGPELDHIVRSCTKSQLNGHIPVTVRWRTRHGKHIDGRTHGQCAILSLAGSQNLCQTISRNWLYAAKYKVHVQVCLQQQYKDYKDLIQCAMVTNQHPISPQGEMQHLFSVRQHVSALVSQSGRGNTTLSEKRVPKRCLWGTFATNGTLFSKGHSFFLNNHVYPKKKSFF